LVASTIYPIRRHSPAPPRQLPSAHDLYPLSLHDALPISALVHAHGWRWNCDGVWTRLAPGDTDPETGRTYTGVPKASQLAPGERSEEHTSELQSRFDLVCRLLLEKKNNDKRQDNRRVTKG